MTDSPFDVVVVGDVFVDEYHWVSSERSAQEASIPVWDVEWTEQRPGGAANVARNLSLIGDGQARIWLVGSFDRQAPVFRRLSGVRLSFSCDLGRMKKERFVDLGENYVLRADHGKFFSPHVEPAVASLLKNLSTVESFSPRVVVVSDYDKGTVGPNVVGALREMIERKSWEQDDGAIATIVDSKRKDLSLFFGMDVLKLNEEEHCRQVAPTDERRCLEESFGSVVVTLGEKGADLRRAQSLGEGKYVVHVMRFSVDPVDDPDVTGCGDTHTAAMAFALAKRRNDFESAVKFANACARSTAVRFGTSVPSDIDARAWGFGSEDGR